MPIDLTRSPLNLKTVYIDTRKVASTGYVDVSFHVGWKSRHDQFLRGFLGITEQEKQDDWLMLISNSEVMG